VKAANLKDATPHSLRHVEAAGREPASLPDEHRRRLGRVVAIPEHCADAIHHPVQGRKGWQLALLRAELFNRYVDEVRWINDYLSRVEHSSYGNFSRFAAMPRP
jgi:hypothetical protein